MPLTLLYLMLLMVVLVCFAQASPPTPMLAGKIIPLNENAAYSWFSEPRAIVHDDKLIVGSVRAVDTFRSGQNDPTWGSVEVSVCDLKTGTAKTIVLHRYFDQDDHDDPAFLPLPDNRLLALYSKHAIERKAYARISEPNNPLAWGDPIVIETPGKDSRPFSGDNVTYSNLFRFPNGRIYDFYRGFGYDPNYMFSDDDGRTWKYGGRLLIGKNGYGPYVKYAYDGEGTLHFLATEDHPRNYDNSIYHGSLRDGQICDSYGKPLAKLSVTTDASLASWDLTKVFAGDGDNVAWMCDIKLDREKHPYITFSVQKDGKGMPKGEAGFDHRFFYGRFDGKQWSVNELAYAGTRLYRGEDDYTGLAMLDPDDPEIVYISTNAIPTTGAPLISSVDNQRHHELFRGKTADGGKTWKWEPLTANSVFENVRPIVLRWNEKTVLVWMRGGYFNNRGQWTTTISAMILN